MMMIVPSREERSVKPSGAAAAVFTRTCPPSMPAEWKVSASFATPYCTRGDAAGSLAMRTSAAAAPASSSVNNIVRKIMRTPASIAPADAQRHPRLAGQLHRRLAHRAVAVFPVGRDAEDPIQRRGRTFPGVQQVDAE